MATWIERTLVASPYYVALCRDEKDFHRELKRLKVPRKEWPPFVSTPQADATVHYLVKGDGKHLAIVCIRRCKGRTRAQIDALLCHESVHIWQEIRQHIGEKEPSSEFEAYSIQSIFQRLVEAYHDHHA